MNLCFFLERGSPPRTNPVLEEVFWRLRDRGHEARAVYAEEELLRLDRFPHSADLYLLKSDSELSLSLARGLAERGERILNRVEACSLAKDKTLAAVTLSRAGIPSPRAFVSGDPALLAGPLSQGPVILKPNRGYHGAGVAVAASASSLPPRGSYPDMVFAQEYLGDARKDLKIFGIGERIFGVRKPFSKESYARAGEPVVLPREVEELSRRCAEAFGLELFGLDVAESEDGYRVIDVNYFPGYRGVPDAARILLDYVLEAARSPNVRAAS